MPILVYITQILLEVASAKKSQTHKSLLQCVQTHQASIVKMPRKVGIMTTAALIWKSLTQEMPGDTKL